MNTLTINIDLLLNSSTVNEMSNNAQRISDKLCLEDFHVFKINNYNYAPDLAIEELGLDLDLIQHLIEDYVIQILKSSITFIEFANELKDLKLYTNNLDFTSLRDLAHKNLGVARNLRIKDSEKLLEKIMISDDLDLITKYTECLFSRSILLNPTQAYNAIRLMHLKETF